MPQELDEIGRVNFIAGQVHALRAFAAAIAMLSREDGRLAVEFEKASQMALVLLEKTRAMDSMFDGFHDTTKSLRKALGTPET